MSRRKKVTLSSFRSTLYELGKVTGDIQAVRRGRIGPRLWNRAVGKLAGRALGKIRL